MSTAASLTITNGRVSSEERQAGIVAKQFKLTMPPGFWICLVRQDMLRIDDHQRDPDLAHIRKIVDVFDPLYVNMPVCTFRNDGKLPGCHVYVEDGQHTARVLRAKNQTIELDNGMQVIQCLVHFDLDKAAAAKMFYRKNDNNKPVPQWTALAAAAAAGDTTACGVLELATKHRLTNPVNDGKKLKDYDLRHPALYRRIIEEKKFGKTVLDGLFKLQAATFRGQKHSTPFLKALLRYMIGIGYRNPADLVRSMKRANVVDEIMEAAANIVKENKQKARALGKKPKAADRPDEAEITQAFERVLQRQSDRPRGKQAFLDHLRELGQSARP